LKVNDEMPKARVFIGCGQQSDKEKELGFVCVRYLEKRGFSVYLAEEIQSLEALTENIFDHLRNSEYAVFIDCARKELRDGEFRGSVFVNQELAIATFLKIESRVFHEKGVKREGVVEYLIAKPIHFSDKYGFLRTLGKQTKDWRNDWTNELSLKSLPVVPNVQTQNGYLTDWYHLQVTNNHQNKHARNCVAYVSKIKNLDTGTDIKSGNFELVWAGTGLFERHISPKRPADVDAFFIIRGQDSIRFHHRPSTSTQYGMPLLHNGNYLLTYLIVSENFDSVTRTFKLEFGGDFTKIRFFAI